MTGIILSGLSVGMAVAFLWHFYNIATRGSMVIAEPNPYILGAEIVMLCSILVFSVYMFIGYLKNEVN